MGVFRLSDVNSFTTTAYQVNQTNAAITFDTAAKWTDITARVGISAALIPDYGVPPIPMTYVTVNVPSEFIVKAATFVMTHDCLPTSKNNYTLPGDLLIEMPTIVFDSEWVPWQTVYDIFFSHVAWVDFLGTSWLTEASKAIAKDVNAFVNKEVTRPHARWLDECHLRALFEVSSVTVWCPGLVSRPDLRPS